MIDSSRAPLFIADSSPCSAVRAWPTSSREVTLKTARANEHGPRAPVSPIAGVYTTIPFRARESSVAAVAVVPTPPPTATAASGLWCGNVCRPSGSSAGGMSGMGALLAMGAVAAPASERLQRLPQERANAQSRSQPWACYSRPPVHRPSSHTHPRAVPRPHKRVAVRRPPPSYRPPRPRPRPLPGSSCGGPQARYIRPRSDRYPPEMEVVVGLRAIVVLVVRPCVRGSYSMAPLVSVAPGLVARGIGGTGTSGWRAWLQLGRKKARTAASQCCEVVIRDTESFTFRGARKELPIPSPPAWFASARGTATGSGSASIDPAGRARRGARRQSPTRSHTGGSWSLVTGPADACGAESGTCSAGSSTNPATTGFK